MLQLARREILSRSWRRTRGTSHLEAGDAFVGSIVLQAHHTRDGARATILAVLNAERLVVKLVLVRGRCSACHHSSIGEAIREALSCRTHGTKERVVAVGIAIVSAKLVVAVLVVVVFVVLVVVIIVIVFVVVVIHMHGVVVVLVLVGEPVRVLIVIVVFVLERIARRHEATSLTQTQLIAKSLLLVSLKVAPMHCTTLGCSGGSVGIGIGAGRSGDRCAVSNGHVARPCSRYSRWLRRSA